MKTLYNCPHCHKMVKDLSGHIARMHSEEPSEPKTKGKKLELEVKAKTKEETLAQQYHCVDCGYEPVTKGQVTCPGCGKALDWSQV